VHDEDAARSVSVENRDANRDANRHANRNATRDALCMAIERSIIALFIHRASDVAIPACNPAASLQNKAAWGVGALCHPAQTPT
jgi:hypothetical protein